MASNAVGVLSFCFELLFVILQLPFSSVLPSSTTQGFSIQEATVYDLQLAFQKKQLSSKQVVEFYLKQIETQNSVLRGVLELNPDALAQAEKADKERKSKAPGSLSPLHGIPILVKDTIATKDRMNTTAGSFALLGSVVPRDAGVVTRLRKAGAIIIGKATLSEWSHYRSVAAPDGWSARGRHGKNPYTMDSPCGSSSGSAISVAANLVAVSLGTETDGSILCPSDSNSVVGIKPTVGLTSRAGVVPVSPRQDTVGPICRTVADAALLLQTIAGIDTNDKATIIASKYIPKGGYAQFLRKDGLRGKRLGVLRYFYAFGNDTFLHETFELHLKTLRERGAVLVDNLEIENIDEVYSGPSEGIAVAFEFKSSLNAYLKDLVASPVRSLADVIAFNNKHSKLEKVKEYGEDLMVNAQNIRGSGTLEEALSNLTRLSKDGFEKVMIGNKLDAVVVPCASFSSVLAIGGYPGVTVPAGYQNGRPFGICFGGLRGSEPNLIQIAYSFEQATMIRKPPPLPKL
ncbi:probable amidase At4g34880 isoform X2 [Vigna unguiculata]|nr:probable amidase At4g34880 isoform X2 [Vigna unguiculata]XP_027917148.1 probable amidase At4g34880 isoform X2 [Vigna unguiculata]XP_027917149.1 probable amidase At4g34880 isoform X2 [Vigna unguiculata]